MIQQKQNKIQILLTRVGGHHKYQYLLFFLFCVKWIIAAMILFSLNFFYIVPSFNCSKSQMSGYKTCTDFVCSKDDQNFWVSHMQKPLPNSISLDYGVIMVCSKQWIGSLLQSMSYVGSFFGYIVMGHIADNKGRKIAEIISWGICIAGQIILLFSINLPMVGFGSFFLGFGANAAITIHYSLMKQFVMGKMRSRMIIAIQIAFSIGISLISLLSYLISNWKLNLGIFILAPSIIVILGYKIMEQTPQFSLKKGITVLKDSFNKIAKINGRDPLQIEQMESVLQNYNLNEQPKQLTIISLFTYKSLRWITISCAIIDLTVQFIYDGTLLSLDKFGINVYFNQILVGLVEVSAAIFATYIIPRVQRKQYTTIAFFLIAVISIIMGIQTLTYTHVTNDVNFHTIIEMVIMAFIRFLVNSVWGVFFVYVSELFPSEVSSLSFAWISVMGTIGASASPYIRLAAADLTMFIMAGLAIVMVFLIRSLTQTKDKPLRSKIIERQQQENKSNQQKRKSVISLEQ